MLRRFVSGLATGAVVIAAAALILVLFGPGLPRTWPLTTMWCFVPFLWGVWAVLTPQAWLPERLPYWGAILGFLGGTLGAFVLDMPARVFALTVPFVGRLVALAVVTIAYYFLWMLVRAVYRNLAPPQPGAAIPAVGPQLKKAA